MMYEEVEVIDTMSRLRVTNMQELHHAGFERMILRGNASLSNNDKSLILAIMLKVKFIETSPCPNYNTGRTWE